MGACGTVSVGGWATGVGDFHAGARQVKDLNPNQLNGQGTAKRPAFSFERNGRHFVLNRFGPCLDDLSPFCSITGCPEMRRAGHRAFALGERKLTKSAENDEWQEPFLPTSGHLHAAVVSQGSSGDEGYLIGW